MHFYNYIACFFKNVQRIIRGEEQSSDCINLSVSFRSQYAHVTNSFGLHTGARVALHWGWGHELRESLDMQLVSFWVFCTRSFKGLTVVFCSICDLNLACINDVCVGTNVGARCVTIADCHQVSANQHNISIALYWWLESLISLDSMCFAIPRAYVHTVRIHLIFFRSFFFCDLPHHRHAWYQGCWRLVQQQIRLYWRHGMHGECVRRSPTWPAMFARYLHLWLLLWQQLFCVHCMEGTCKRKNANRMCEWLV